MLSADNQFRNETLDRTPLDNGRDTAARGRVDVAWQTIARMQVEAGALVESTRRRSRSDSGR